jgi:hypothetical protein
VSTLAPFETRRSFLIGSAALVAVTLSEGLGAAPSPAGGFVMWHSPGCGCCIEWSKRVEAAFGRKLPILEVPNLARVKDAQAVPTDLRSCHTALIGGYVIEGHVPPADIRRLIGSRNRTIRGLAVPGMPAGSPGMDVGHDRRDPYQVIAFAAGGRRRLFARHG